MEKGPRTPNVEPTPEELRINFIDALDAPGKVHPPLIPLFEQLRGSLIHDGRNEEIKQAYKELLPLAERAVGICERRRELGAARYFKGQIGGMRFALGIPVVIPEKK